MPTTAHPRPRLRRLLPENRLARSLAVQSGLYAVGSGVFMAGSAVFFTQIVGLTAAQVGLGISLAGLASLVLAVPLGRVADALGPRRTWGVAAAGEAAVYFAYPVAHGMAAFLAIVVALAVMEAAGSAGRNAYTIDALPPGERVRTQAYLRSTLNVGFTVGALVSGLALGSGERGLVAAVPVFAGAALALNAVLVTRLPEVRHEGAAAAPEARMLAPKALRNTAFLRLALVNGLLALDGPLFEIVIPLWLVQRTDAPHALVAWLFATNTVMAVLLQVLASRGAETVRGAVRAGRLAAAAIVVTSLLAVGTASTSTYLTVGLLWLAIVAVTASELWHSASSWGLVAELSDPARRAEYQGVWKAGLQAGTVAAPAALTWLVVSWGPQGWLVVAGLAVLGGVLLGPAAEAAQRSLARGKPVGEAVLPADTIEQSV